MTKALLIDLDGTLLQTDTGEFVKQYMKSLSFYIKDYYQPEKFINDIMYCTEEMIKDLDSNYTNKDIFLKRFLERTGVSHSEVWPILDTFYLDYFPKLKEHIKPTAISKDIVNIAKEQGRKVVIATNPLFPKAAIVERLRWLDLEESLFDLVTSYEDSHFCKPHGHYYQEILDKIDTRPEDAIMIGNDMQEDMVASELGINTYLVNNYFINRHTSEHAINQSGTIATLKEELQNYIGIFG